MKQTRPIPERPAARARLAALTKLRCCYMHVDCKHSATRWLMLSEELSRWHADLAAETELPDTLHLVIIPYHDLQGTVHTHEPYTDKQQHHANSLCKAVHTAHEPNHAWRNVQSYCRCRRNTTSEGAAVTLVGGYFGAGPPPTIARMLHLNNISTIPMPPLLKPRQNCNDVLGA